MHFGPQTEKVVLEFYPPFVFRRLRDLMTNVFETKQDVDNQGTALETANGPLRCPRII